MIKRTVLIFTSLCLFAGFSIEALAEEKVKIRVLNKVTGKSNEVILEKNKVEKISNLEIKAEKCIITSHNQTEEHMAFLTVTENIPGKEPLPVFSGWMFATRPALSYPEHPFYNIRMLECVGEEFGFWREEKVNFFSKLQTLNPKLKKRSFS